MCYGHESLESTRGNGNENGIRIKSHWSGERRDKEDKIKSIRNDDSDHYGDFSDTLIWSNEA